MSGSTSHRDLDSLHRQPRVPSSKPAPTAARLGRPASLSVVNPADKTGDFLLATLWRNSPSWLLSAVLHGIALLVLVTSWITPAAEQKGRSLAAQIAGLDVDDLDFSTLEDRLDDVELPQVAALPVRIEEPGLAAFGEVGKVELASVAVPGQRNTGTGIGELGVLFGRDGKGWSAAGEGLGGAEFYGIKATGNRFVFVVDGSRSMGRSEKWASCKRELLAAVSKLRPSQHFYVYLFAGGTERMFGDADPVRQMVPASAANVYRLRRWLDGYLLQGGTVPRVALQEALESLRPDAVYLLSDGQFTDGGGSEKYLVHFARTRNNRRNRETGAGYGVAVHTIAFASRRGEVVLNRIADAFHGTFKYVPAFK